MNRDIRDSCFQAFGAAVALLLNYGVVDGRWAVGAARATGWVLGVLLYYIARGVWVRVTERQP